MVSGLTNTISMPNDIKAALKFDINQMRSKYTLN